MSKATPDSLAELIRRATRRLETIGLTHRQDYLYCRLGEFGLTRRADGALLLEYPSGDGGWNTGLRVKNGAVLAVAPEIFPLLDLLRSEQVLDDIANV